MLKNRSFLVKPIKDSEMTPINVEPVDYNRVVETIAKNAVIVIAAYMGGDTLRQVLIHIAKTGIQAE